MSVLAQHIRIRLRDDRVMAPTPEERRLLARVVLHQARHENLLTFGLADTHLHMENVCSWEAAGQRGRRVELSLRYRLRLPVGFVSVYREPIRDGRHLVNAFNYILKQSSHHGLRWDPLHEASNLPDLLGMRPLGQYTAANVRKHLPRVTRQSLLSRLGVDALEPHDGPVERIPEAVIAAAGLADLRGSQPEKVGARRAVVHLVGDRMKVGELAEVLCVSRRTVFRLRRQPVDASLIEAARLQFGLMQKLQQPESTAFLAS